MDSFVLRTSQCGRVRRHRSGSLLLRLLVHRRQLRRMLRRSRTRRCQRLGPHLSELVVEQLHRRRPLRRRSDQPGRRMLGPLRRLRGRSARRRRRLGPDLRQLVVQNLGRRDLLRLRRCQRRRRMLCPRRRLRLRRLFRSGAGRFAGRDRRAVCRPLRGQGLLVRGGAVGLQRHAEWSVNAR